LSTLRSEIHYRE